MLTLVTDDPPQHTRHRALVDRVFSVSTVAALVPRINAIVDALIDKFIERGSRRSDAGTGGADSTIGDLRANGGSGERAGTTQALRRCGHGAS